MSQSSHKRRLIAEWVREYEAAQTYDCDQCGNTISPGTLYMRRPHTVKQTRGHDTIEVEREHLKPSCWTNEQWH